MSKQLGDNADITDIVREFTERLPRDVQGLRFFYKEPDARSFVHEFFIYPGLGSQLPEDIENVVTCLFNTCGKYKCECEVGMPEWVRYRGSDKVKVNCRKIGMSVNCGEGENRISIFLLSSYEDGARLRISA